MERRERRLKILKLSFNMRGFKFLPASKRVVKQLLAAQSDHLPPEEMQHLFCKEMLNNDNLTKIS